MSARAVHAARRRREAAREGGTLMFFYGTLMSDGMRGHLLLERNLARPVGTATVRGDLHNVWGGAFPALTDGDGVVHGELWEALPGKLNEALAVTDMIEGYREGDEWSMYLRVERALFSAKGAGYAGDKVYTYLWNGDSGLTGKIHGGRWVNQRYDEAG